MLLPLQAELLVGTSYKKPLPTWANLVSLIAKDFYNYHLTRQYIVIYDKKRCTGCKLGGEYRLENDDVVSVGPGTGSVPRFYGFFAHDSSRAESVARSTSPCKSLGQVTLALQNLIRYCVFITLYMGTDNKKSVTRIGGNFTRHETSICDPCFVEVGPVSRGQRKGKERGSA